MIRETDIYDLRNALKGVLDTHYALSALAALIGDSNRYHGIYHAVQVIIDHQSIALQNLEDEISAHIDLQ